ncbi:MAG TPA: hypothetical protein VJP86_05500 [Vicinamibacterales bacterium]|jgi:hypothetical protein|nr:hypothetical protein [Vicinamibacterales bacterium]
MFSNRLALAALGLGCLTAAGIGGFLATRQDATQATAVHANEQVSPETIESLPAVEETEAALEKADAPASQDRAKPPVQSGQSRGASSRVQPATRSAPTAADSRPPATSAPDRIDQTHSAPATQPIPPAEATASLPQPSFDPPDPISAPTPVPDPITADARSPEPPSRRLEELVVSADSVVGLRIETGISSERAQVEDRVEARVVRDIRVGGSVAVPAGSKAIGSVTLVERGGKMKDRARLGIRFHTLVLADGSRVPVNTEAIYRTGDSPGNKSAAKIGGGAAAGAILGAIIGGAKGAAIGGSIGAGAGSASVMTSDPSTATFPTGTEVNARILSPVTVTVEHQ